MTPEEKELFKRSIALAEQNNDILRSIQRSLRFARFMSIIYWVVIIGSAVGAFYFIKPYIGKVTTMYDTATQTINSFR